MEEKIEVDYNNLLGMLKSKDDENKVLALSILENVSFEENFVKMMLLKKEANIDFEFWQAHAPTSVKALKKIYSNVQVSVNLPPTHYHMLLLLRAGITATESELALFLEESFKAYLSHTGLATKYPVDFTINIKSNE
jgi:hypothetical protein